MSFGLGITVVVLLTIIQYVHVLYTLWHMRPIQHNFWQGIVKRWCVPAVSALHFLIFGFSIE